LPQSFLGFTPEIREPREGEFNPNGTWVFGTEPLKAASETWPACQSAVPAVLPTAALLGSYANEAGAPGIGQAFEFASDQDAKAWFDAYAAELGHCRATPAAFTIVDLDATDTQVVDRRSMSGLPWSERVWVDGPVVLFMIVQADVTLDELRSAV